MSCSCDLVVVGQPLAWAVLQVQSPQLHLHKAWPDPALSLHPWQHEIISICFLRR